MGLLVGMIVFGAALTFFALAVPALVGTREAFGEWIRLGDPMFFGLFVLGLGISLMLIGSGCALGYAYLGGA